MPFVPLGQVLEDAERRGSRRALIVTALGTEIRGVLAHLTTKASVRGRGGMIYECGEFDGAACNWLVVVVQSGPGNEAAQGVTQTAHHDFDVFDVMMFVGVAGSRKSDVPIGSVIAADRVYSPYGGKFDTQGFSSRPRMVETPPELVQLAMKVERDEEWQSRIQAVKDGPALGTNGYPEPFPPAAFVKPIVSVDAVMANPESDLEKQIAQYFGDAHGVEMEGFGATFGASIERTPAIVIRGISDMAAHKEAKTDAIRQPISVAHASAFAFEMLDLLMPTRRLEPRTDRLRAESSSVDRGVPDPRLDTAAGGESVLGTDSLVNVPGQAEGSSTTRRPESEVPPSGGHFVLNLAGSVDDYTPERLEALLVAIRTASGDESIEILKIKPGSVRLFVSANIADLETLRGLQVREAIQDVGVELLGVIPEQALANLEIAQADLEAASHDLAAWPQTLPGGERLERPELSLLLEKFDESDSSATVVLGPPGSGKSTLLARVAQEVAERGWPVLGIKSDILDPNVADEAGLQRQLMLAEAPSALLSRLAAFGPVVMIIDQLDALAGFVDLRTGRLNVLLHLIRKLARRPNVHVVLSARTFEYNHDVRLRSIEADTVNLELPPWREILPVLATRDLKPEGWPPDAQETLRTPQHLATFLRLADSGTAEPFQNYQSMLERLWIERVLQAPDGEHFAKLATDIANAMAEEESLWLARSRYDEKAKYLQELERLGILTSSADGGAVGFTHQTLYDYVLARSFTRGTGRLSAYVAGREASLFLRPKLWVALTYLRNVEIGTYERELTTIWKSESLRAHLKLLLIDFVGQQKDPTAAERRLMKPILESDPDRPAAFRAIVGSPGWFDAAGSAIAAAMRESEQAAWLVTGLLQQAWRFAPERAFSLIQKHWAPYARFDPHTWTVFSELAEWSDAIADLAVRALNRTQISHYHIEHVVAHLGVAQPEIALRLVRACLDRDLAAAVEDAAERAKRMAPPGADEATAYVWQFENAPEKPLERLLAQSHHWDVLTSLAETAPGPFIDAVWPWFTDVMRAVVSVKGSADSETYPLMWTFDFRFEGERDGFDLPPSPILNALAIAVENLARAPDQLRRWLAENLEVDAVPAQRLFAHALIQNGETYAEDAFRFLMGDARRFYLGNLHDQSGTTKALIRVASPHWSNEMRETFVHRVRTYRPPRVSVRVPASRRRDIRALRHLRLDLLKCLPQESLDDEVRSYVRTESRVFGDGNIGIRSSGFRTIGSPMSSEAMLKASDEDILNAFREVPDHTEWDHPRDHFKGGNIQLSRAFSEFSKQKPERAARIIKRFTPEIGLRASGMALDAMGESAEPDVVVATFLDAVRRGFVSQEFQGSAARGIERLVERGVIIGDEVLVILQDWLGDAPVPKMDHENNDDSDERRNKDEEQEARSILWDGRHFSVLPHGNFPIMETLTRILIARKEHDRIIDIWERHLEKREDPKVWGALLRLVPYIHPTEEGARGRLIGEIFSRYPQVAESVDAVALIGSAHWWAPDQVRELLVTWRHRNDPWVQQVSGEIQTLIALVQPELGWAGELLNEDLSPEAPIARRIGIAFSAANLWDNPSFRTRANEVLLALIPDADAKLWRAILDIFRVVEELGDAPEAASLLDAIATHFHEAGGQTSPFLAVSLQGLLPEHAVVVGRLVEGMISNLSEELGDIRTRAAISSPELVDIALTLHRLGGPTRELGVELFEQLLRLDAYSARATLEEIDSRFRTSAYSATRPRLPRRSRRRGRRAGL